MEQVNAGEMPPKKDKEPKPKGLEVGAAKATPQALTHIAKLPLEYLQLGEGFESGTCVAHLKDLATLRRLTLTTPKASPIPTCRPLPALRSSLTWRSARCRCPTNASPPSSRSPS